MISFQESIIAVVFRRKLQKKLFQLVLLIVIILAGSCDKRIKGCMPKWVRDASGVQGCVSEEKRAIPPNRSRTVPRYLLHVVTRYLV